MDVQVLTTMNKVPTITCWWWIIVQMFAWLTLKFILLYSFFLFREISPNLTNYKRKRKQERENEFGFVNCNLRTAKKKTAWCVLITQYYNYNKLIISVCILYYSKALKQSLHHNPKHDPPCLFFLLISCVFYSKGFYHFISQIFP